MPDLTGPVAVVGAGMVGTSIALACRHAGLEVLLDDAAPRHLRTAVGLGAGRPVEPGDSPELVVVAVPPAHLAETIVACLGRWPGAVVTDVGSVKTAPLEAVAARVSETDLARYVGAHPMAGSERSGPLAASPTLCEGRPFAVTPHARASSASVDVVLALARTCGGVPSVMDPAEHDLAVARTSYLPHLAAVLVAGSLAAAPADHLALSGQGVRDVTRIAASDPALWRQILVANAAAVLPLLADLRADVDVLMAAAEQGDGEALVALLERGNAGTAAIPGKHGAPMRPTATVYVSVPDHPGELARLFGDAGEIGTNIEDVRIDHDPGRPVGLTELVVLEAEVDHLLEALESRGWDVHR